MEGGLSDVPDWKARVDAHILQLPVHGLGFFLGPWLLGTISRKRIFASYEQVAQILMGPCTSYHSSVNLLQGNLPAPRQQHRSTCIHHPATRTLKRLL